MNNEAGQLTGEAQPAPPVDKGQENSKHVRPGEHVFSKYNHEAKFNALQQDMTLTKWCACLTSAVLRTRTPFAAHLAQTFHLHRTDLSTALAFFPVPLPTGEHWARMPPDLSQKRRRQVHLNRAVHISVLALNYYHNGGPCKLDLLGRAPSTSHRSLYARIRSLIRSEGQVAIPCIANSGRRLPQLVARLSELSVALTAMGPSCNPYDRSFDGFEVLPDTEADELKPYRNLDSSRLVLTGRGAWDATEYLEDELVLAYREPASLLFSHEPCPSQVPAISDHPSEAAALARLWDNQDLLYLHDGKDFELSPQCFTRVFNAYKNAKMDGQIGDRRSRNSCESRVRGPSTFLPSGPDLSDWYCNPKTHYIAQGVTDRKDFYHQFHVSRSRAFSNTVGPAVEIEDVKNLKAYSDYILRQAKGRYQRSLHGDRLGMKGLRAAQRKPQQLFVAFRSVLQGDHAGVDIATSAHTALLQSHGLLEESCQLQSCKPLFDLENCEGLCIDDYFAMSLEQVGTPLQASKASQKIGTARAAYRQAELLGSPEKDILSDKAKIVGAVVNSSSTARDQGLVTLSAPIEKRIALSVISLQLATLTHTTDALHVCLVGGWISAAMYRRPVMGLFHKVFSLVDSASIDPNHPKIIRLPRTTANELVLASVLVPLMCAELSAEFSTQVFCSDASSNVGAFCAATVPRAVSRVLWKACKSKGAYTRMMSPVEAEIFKLGGSEEFEGKEEVKPTSIRRPLAYRFDFIELFAGAAKVTHSMEAKGWSVGPPIDLSHSPEYDMTSHYLMSWLSHLIQSHAIKSFACEPPCTTFCIMRRPQLRSKERPYGFDPSHPQTHTGTALALRGLQCLELGWRHGVPGWLETTYSSKMKFLPPYKTLRAKRCVDFCRTDSCRFGSPHLKPFAFLSVWAPLDRIRQRCVCKGRHVVIEGKLTKASAMYTDGLADALATVLSEAINARASADLEWDQVQTAGLENALVNQVALEAPWSTLRSWPFRRPVHINIQEAVSVLKVVEHLILKWGPQRAAILVDSNVVRCAVSKGRTSSKGLMPVIAKVNALCLAAGVQICLPFCPTRLNPSDDPTRGAALRSPIQGCDLFSFSEGELAQLSTCAGLRRWSANWVRLMLSLLGPGLVFLKDRSRFRSPCALDFRPSLQTHFEKGFDQTLGYPGEGPGTFDPASRHTVLHNCRLEFDRTLGFPGEGPSPLLFISLLLLLCLFQGKRDAPLLWISGAILGGPRYAMGMPLKPRNSGDRARAEHRAQKLPLASGRPVLQITAKHREELLEAFRAWLLTKGLEPGDLFHNTYQTVEEINILLTAYGRELYRAGRPLNHFSETINAIASWKPQLRRALQGAWDLAYSWVKSEPSTHHTAMSPQVLMSCISVCLIWGWVRLAGCLALTWGGLLRAGELLQARRQDLQLPSDLAGSVPFALLSIKEPKTRHTTARHQCAKLDIPDLVQLAELAFQKLAPSEPLWDMSAQTLRSRFKSLLQAQRLPTSTYRGMRALDLGSLRPGGATHILQLTESGDLVMRRGRWASYRVMSIYIQEVTSTSFLSVLDKDVRDNILDRAQCFSYFLEQAKAFESARIPRDVWHFLFGATQKKDA